MGIIKRNVVGGVFLFKELIIAARNGDSASFAELSNLYNPLIVAMIEKYSRSIGASEADRDDLRQEVTVAFYKAVTTFDTDQDEVSFGLYAKICIRNRLVSLLRSSKSKSKRAKLSHGNADKEPAKPRDAFIFASELQELSRKILSKREREVFMMYADGRSYSDIASAVGITEKSVDNALFRAKKKLRLHYSER
jgi:RNA polymerase sporulation-specific sigma factor